MATPCRHGFERVLSSTVLVTATVVIFLRVDSSLLRVDSSLYCSADWEVDVVEAEQSSGQEIRVLFKDLMTYLNYTQLWNDFTLCGRNSCIYV